MLAVLFSMQIDRHSTRLLAWGMVGAWLGGGRFDGRGRMGVGAGVVCGRISERMRRMLEGAGDDGLVHGRG